MAMEYAPGGDMFEYVVKHNGLKEEEARWFFQQLVVGMDYCHRMVSTGVPWAPSAEEGGLLRGIYMHSPTGCSNGNMTDWHPSSTPSLA